MSRLPRSELAPVADEIRRLIVDRFGTKDDFMITPAVIAELFGDSYLDTFNLRQAHGCHIGNVMGASSPFLVNLHAALVAKGHGRLNPFEISSCDRRVSFIETADPKVKLLAFENQNVTYMVLLKPDIMSKYVGDKVMRYAMHVRSSTPASYSNRHSYNNPGIKGLPHGDELAKAFTEHGGYFHYLDCRDRGFVASVTAESAYKINADGSNTNYDELVWIGKDSTSMIYMGSYMLDELRGFATMWRETFEELEYEVVDTALERA